MSRTVKEIVADLAPAYKEWKGGEKTKNKLRDEFFEAITSKLQEDGEAAEDLIIVEATSGVEAIEEAQRRRPGWLVEDWRPSPDLDGSYEVIVVENPEFMPFTIEFDGQVWGRQITEGDSMLDNEKIEADDPDLWKRVTAYPNQSLLEDIAYGAGMDPNDHAFEMNGYKGFDGYIEWQCERHGVKRSLKPFDDIADEDLAALQGYMYSGPPKVKLPAPKKVKG